MLPFIDDSDDTARRQECQFFRHVLCFFLCYDVRPQMARFLWLMTAVLTSMALFFGARGIARAYHMEHDFTAPHWIALLILVVAHAAFLGLKYEDASARHPDSNIDPVMVRIAIASLVVCVSLGIGLSTVMEHWWTDPISEEEYVHGPRPQHASPSAKPESSTNGGIPLPFKSPSRTPSQTPSSSPDPSIRRREFQAMSDHRATVGGVYVGSLLCGVAAVALNYNLRMLPVAFY